MSKGAALMHYSIVIEWSEDDQAYVVFLPEWHRYNGITNGMPCTHGNTYEEAFKHGLEVLEMLIDHARAAGDGQQPRPDFYCGCQVRGRHQHSQDRPNTRVHSV